ncbi:hypothetical protein ACFL49_03510 [Candidatus Omnitrophota bacterium]
MSYTLGKEKYSASECKRRGMNFSAPLKVKLRLITPVDIKEQEVYFVLLLLMVMSELLFLKFNVRLEFHLKKNFILQEKVYIMAVLFLHVVHGLKLNMI